MSPCSFITSSGAVPVPTSTLPTLLLPWSSPMSSVSSDSAPPAALLPPAEAGSGAAPPTDGPAEEGREERRFWTFCSALKSM